MSRTVLLAFSGGLDTTFCLLYLQEQGFQVETITVDTGGFSHKENEKIEKWAYKLGAKKHYHVDAGNALFAKFVSPLIKANYLRNGTYPPCVGPERAVIVEEICKISKNNSEISAIAHGSTGAGGDQIRFESSLQTILPKMEIFAPIRELGLSREKTLEYIKSKGVEFDAKNKDYSVNTGLIGNTIGGKETLDTKQSLPDLAFPNANKCNNLQKHVISLEFEAGNIMKINGKSQSGVEIMQALNEIGFSTGYGRGYHIGTSILGLKARLGFEAPGYKILIFAHCELEKTVLTSKQIFWKNHLGNVYGDMIHEGHFYEPLLLDIEAMINSANNFVTGEVVLSISHGNLQVESINSRYSMFNKTVGTYGETMSAWSGADAKSFAKLHSFEAKNAYWTRYSNDFE